VEEEEKEGESHPLSDDNTRDLRMFLPFLRRSGCNSLRKGIGFLSMPENRYYAARQSREEFFIHRVIRIIYDPEIAAY